MVDVQLCSKALETVVCNSHRVSDKNLSSRFEEAMIKSNGRTTIGKSGAVTRTGQSRIASVNQKAKHTTGRFRLVIVTVNYCHSHPSYWHYQPLLISSHPLSSSSIPHMSSSIQSYTSDCCCCQCQPPTRTSKAMSCGASCS